MKEPTDALRKKINRIYHVCKFPVPDHIRIYESPSEIKSFFHNLNLHDSRISVLPWLKTSPKESMLLSKIPFTYKLNTDIIANMASHILPNISNIQPNNKESYVLTWFFKNTVLLLEQPTYHNVKYREFDDETTVLEIFLHRKDGPVISFPDGFALYYLNNILMPPDLWEKPIDQINVAQLMLKYQNAEVRKELAKRVGPSRIIRSMNAQVIDKWLDYTLYGMYVDEIRTPIHCLRMVNPSTGEDHWEYVHPSCMSVQEALSWRINGLKWNPSQLT